MRKPRFLAHPEVPVAFYHCVSRVVDRDFKLGEVERECFVRYLRDYAALCGIQVLTYCVLSNHFHVLVAVPRRPSVALDDEALLARLERFYPAQRMARIRERWAQVKDQPEERAAWRERYLKWMWDLSQFMKLLKQRFSRWYNRNEQRRGTLWEERYRSVVVEGTEQALRMVAAYIDLNPVRAGMVSDPKDYRWSGYGAAMGGEREAWEGLMQVMEAGSWEEAQGRYRHGLYQEGGATFSREAAREVQEAGGRLSVGEALRCRVRYLVDGAALGSRAFVEEVFVRYRRYFGSKRQDGARPMRGLEAGEVFTLRDLRVNRVG